MFPGRQQSIQYEVGVLREHAMSPVQKAGHERSCYVVLEGDLQRQEWRTKIFVFTFKLIIYFVNAPVTNPRNLVLQASSFQMHYC
jgi:hypothetical protein